MLQGLMFGDGISRGFLAGVFCGALVGLGVGAFLWWKPHPTRSVEDGAIYDRCLVQKAGNTVACDALMRLLAREKAAQTADDWIPVK
jgi:hypothetical protein